MTKYDALNKLTNKELLMIINKCQTKLVDIDKEADRLEESNEYTEDRFNELSEHFYNVFNIKTKAEEILNSRTSDFTKIFSQIGLE